MPAWAPLMKHSERASIRSFFRVVVGWSHKWFLWRFYSISSEREDLAPSRGAFFWMLRRLFSPHQEEQKKTLKIFVRRIYEGNWKQEHKLGGSAPGVLIPQKRVRREEIKSRYSLLIGYALVFSLYIALPWCLQWEKNSPKEKFGLFNFH